MRLAITSGLPVAKWFMIVSPNFVRAPFPLDQDRVMIGLSPATIIEVDYKQGKLLDLYQYSNNVEVCLHGLLVLP